MADSSFDIVSKVDHQEVDNAINQAKKEVSQRYDFRGVDASVELSGETITLKANSPERVIAVLDVVRSKLIKRGVSPKAFDFGGQDPKVQGKIYVLTGGLREGLSQDVAKQITKLIRDCGPKGVKAQIQGDEIRVSSKSRDALQDVIAMLREADNIDAALQFVNYR